MEINHSGLNGGIRNFWRWCQLLGVGKRPTLDWVKRRVSEFLFFLPPTQDYFCHHIFMIILSPYNAISVCKNSFVMSNVITYLFCFSSSTPVVMISSDAAVRIFTY